MNLLFLNSQPLSDTNVLGVCLASSIIDLKAVKIESADLSLQGLIYAFLVNVSITANIYLTPSFHLDNF